MDRMSTSIDDIIALHRQQTLETSDNNGDSANGPDGDLDLADRPCRTMYSLPLAVGPYGEECFVKENDDIKMDDDQVVRVVCAGRGRSTVTAWSFVPGSGQVLGQFEVSRIVDRAPANSQESGLPIFAQP